MDVILLFPGQGSQKPGMGKELAEAFPEAREVFQQADEALGVNLSNLCFEGPADELQQTHNAQPALLTHGAAVWAVVKDKLAPLIKAAAGHSLGEHTAYHASGAIPLRDAVKLVRTRGQLMHEAGVARPGTMAAILGTLNTPIDDICKRATAEAGEVVPANYNSDEQTVISGEVSGVERAMELAKEAGAKRALKLSVSGAFHSPLVAPAEPKLKEAIYAAPFVDPQFPIYSNVTEQPCTTSDVAREMLVRQLTSPVRWVGLVRNIAANYSNALYVEMGPGSVLTGLMPRIAPGSQAIACGTPADIDKVMERIEVTV